MRSSTLASALEHLRNRVVSTASRIAISTTPRPVRSLIILLLVSASELPGVDAGGYQDGDISDRKEAGSATEPAPVLAASLQQAVNFAVRSHHRHHGSAQEHAHRRRRPDSDTGKGFAKTVDVVFAGLDDHISVPNADDLTAQPQRRAANEQGRHFFRSKDRRGEHAGWEYGQ
jgi:hypothetical protein